MYAMEVFSAAGGARLGLSEMNQVPRGTGLLGTTEQQKPNYLLLVSNS